MNRWPFRLEDLLMVAFLTVATAVSVAHVVTQDGPRPLPSAASFVASPGARMEMARTCAAGGERPGC